VSGEVVAVNEGLADDPGAVNADPYGTGWMIRVKLDGAPTGLLSADDYAKVAAAGH
jgi:glycine cleavage system H protein